MRTSLFKPEHHRFMKGDKEIGLFIVQTDTKGDYCYIFKVNKGVTKDEVPWAFRSDKENEVVVSSVWQRDLHKKLVKAWVEDRIFPRTSEEDVEKLKESLRKHNVIFDELIMLKSTQGKSRHDDFWINFKGN